MLMRNVLNNFLLILPGFAFLVFWQIMTHGNDQRLFFFSAPSVILLMFVNEIQTLSLWRDIFCTGFAAFFGLLLGTVFGSVFGLILWSNPCFSRMTKPYIALLGAIPIFSLAPMMILWFGIGLWSKIMMATFAVFLVASSQAYEGAKETAAHHLMFTRSLSAKSLNVIRYIIFPGSISWIMAGIRMNIGFALVSTFIAEFISSQYGLGHYILKAGGLYDMPRVFVGILLITLLSVSATTVLKYLKRD